MKNPSVNSIVERLPGLPDDHEDFTPDLAMKIMEKYREIIGQRDTIISELQAENRRLTREIQSEKDESDTYCKWWREEQEVTRNIKARLNGAESSLSRIKEETIEECARVAEDEIIWSHDPFEHAHAIASAIRSLGSAGGAGAEEGSTQKEESR